MDGKMHNFEDLKKTIFLGLSLTFFSQNMNLQYF